jgi:hypothetical protein
MAKAGRGHFMHYRPHMSYVVDSDASEGMPSMPGNRIGTCIRANGRHPGEYRHDAVMAARPSGVL